MGIINWAGIEYTFNPLQTFDSNFPTYGGIYVISRKQDNMYKPLYVGQTQDFSDRLTTNHENYDCWIKHSDSCPLYVSLHREDDEDTRFTKESDIIDIMKHDPENPKSLPCNG